MITKIIGPPGTGKTYTLVQLAEKYKTIAGLSFTKAAAQEFSDRVQKSKDYCRTLHSFCFKLLGLRMSDMRDFKLMTQFKEKMGDIGYEMSFYFDEENYQEKRSIPMYLYQLSKNLMMPIQEVYKDGVYDVSLKDVLYVTNCYDNFKKYHSVIDFNDILTQAIEQNIKAPEDIEAVFLDEAQDLTVLQWEVFNQVFANIPDKYIVGDDCQCLYHWAGVDIKKFIDYPCDKIVTLEKSYRLKSNILETSKKIYSKIKTKLARDFQPIAEGGEVSKIHRLDTFGFTSNESYFILARNHFLCRQYAKILKEEGYPFIVDGKASIDLKDVKAIFAWERLRKSGGDFDKEYFKDYTDNFDKEKTWFEAFDFMETEKAIYYRDVLRNGFSIDPKKIQIEITTIHKSKGREADNVIVALDVSSKVFENIEKDEEHKVFYVAVTRAKKRLFILTPETEKYYRGV
jgi:superfamily I DNA/RNA helicase